MCIHPSVYFTVSLQDDVEGRPCGNVSKPALLLRCTPHRCNLSWCPLFVWKETKRENVTKTLLWIPFSTSSFKQAWPFKNTRALHNMNGTFPTFKYWNSPFIFWYILTIRTETWQFRQVLLSWNSLIGEFCLPNTSEGLSSSRSFPPLLVSYVANPPSGFRMLRSFKEEDRKHQINYKVAEQIFFSSPADSPHWRHHIVALMSQAGWWRGRAPAAASPTSNPQQCSQPQSNHSPVY